MTLEADARDVAADFEGSAVAKIVAVLEGIVPLLRNDLTSAYLQKKIDALGATDGADDLRAKCAALRPYVDWYLQGLDAAGDAGPRRG